MTGDTPYVAVGNGETCPFCKQVVITEENGMKHLISCLDKLVNKHENPVEKP